MNTTTTPQACIDVCNSLLRGEISAVETYDQAIEKFADEPGVTVLQQIREDHQASVNRLTTNINWMGGEPDTSSGVWGAFANAVEATAIFFGEDSAVAALTKGEEHGRNEYMSALDNDDVMSDCKRMIREELLPRINEHLRTLHDFTN